MNDERNSSGGPVTNPTRTKTKRYLLAIGLGPVVFAAYVLLFGLWPKYFDIEWDEEVQLHDGRLIVVHIKRTYERIERLDRWAAIHRDTEISFDAGGTIGKFTKKFQRYDVSLVEQKDKNWFIGLVQTTGTPPVEWIDWNFPFLVLDSTGTLRKESIEQFPPEFTRYNVMPDTPDPQRVAMFDATFLTNAEKMRHWSRYPRGAGDDSFIRARKQSNQGELK